MKETVHERDRTVSTSKQKLEQGKGEIVKSQLASKGVSTG